MAKASWVLVDQSNGSGNTTVNVSSNAPHTGRNVRTTILTITAANVEAKTVNVTQQGKPAYVDAQANATAAKDGQNVTISGKANSAKLTFSLGTGNLNVSIPSTYTEGWVTGVAENGVFYRNKNASWNVIGDNGIPFGWTIVTQ